MTNANLPLLRSSHTQNFAEILNRLGISLILATCESGKLITIQENKGQLEVQFGRFQQTRGIAADQRKLAIGTQQEIWEFQNQPAVIQRHELASKYDACYMPRQRHITGNILIHELAWSQKELWFVNTLFSCLCTLDSQYSFAPQWKPAFISTLSPEDRCHLSGLGMLDGKPRIVTALGKSDIPRGWQENKRNGGIVIDVATGEIVTKGLSMPHSPRCYGGKLWILNSGVGGVGNIDLDSGKYQTVKQLSGFTRGLAFYSNLAFVGVSQVRQSTLLDGVPISEQGNSVCGVWVLDIRSGETLAFLRFEEAIQEIFDVQVLSHSRYPSVINENKTLINNSFVLPDEALQPVSWGKVPQAPSKGHKFQKIPAAQTLRKTESSNAPPKKVLLAWELGGGQGHLQRLATLAEHLELEGIEPVFALKSYDIKGRDFPWRRLVCPQLKYSTRTQSFHFADVLEAVGFGDFDLLTSYIQAWRNILIDVKPNLVIADHAPALVLAARGIVPTVLVGTGFTIPPPIEMFPLWDCPLPPESFERQQRVSRIVHHVLNVDLPIGKLFQGDHSLLYCIPELDPYQHLRQGGNYVSIPNTPLPSDLYRKGGESWAYLKDNYVAHQIVLDTLKPVTEFQPLEQALAGKSIAIHHGGLTTSITCLLAGIPQLILPSQKEQKMNALKLCNLGVATAYAPIYPEPIHPKALLAAQEQTQNLARQAQQQAAKLKVWNQNFTELIISTFQQLMI